MIEYEYAKALFELAQEENKINVFLEQLNAIVDTTSKERQFMQIMSCPTIEKNEKIKIVNKVFGKLDDTIVNFLKLLVNNHRFTLIESINEEFLKLYEENKRIVNLEVISSELLNKSQLKLITKRLEGRYPGKELKIENSVNPKILGGLQIICNGESLDLSLKGQLDRLKESL